LPRSVDPRRNQTENQFKEKIMSKTRTAILATAIIAGLGVAGWSAMSVASSHGGHGTHGSHGQMNHGAMHGAGHGAGHGAQSAVPADASPSTRAYMAANDVMHADMAIDFTGNADIDFARGMIPHHEGAIAMARIVLEHGEDPEIRALAEEIIAAQETEIAFLRNWLAAQGQ